MNQIRKESEYNGSDMSSGEGLMKMMNPMIKKTFLSDFSNDKIANLLRA
jgi:hypothetical protein